MDSTLRLLVSACALIAAMVGADTSHAVTPESGMPQMPMDRPGGMMGMRGPMMLSVGCSAICTSGTVSYTCNASGANASCTSNAARTNSVCTDGNSTTTCNCTGPAQGCSTTTP